MGLAAQDSIARVRRGGWVTCGWPPTTASAPLSMRRRASRFCRRSAGYSSHPPVQKRDHQVRPVYRPGRLQVSLLPRAGSAGFVIESGWHNRYIAHHQPPDEMEPCERLLGDAANGGASLFAREDSVEPAWRVEDPILGDTAPPFECEPNTWGPPEADRNLMPTGGWE